MNRLVSWLARRQLTPAAAQIEFLKRHLAICESKLSLQQSLLRDQQEALKCLKAALIKAQFEAEGWQQIAKRQARQMQFAGPTRTTQEAS